MGINGTQEVKIKSSVCEAAVMQMMPCVMSSGSSCKHCLFLSAPGALRLLLASSNVHSYVHVHTISHVESSVQHQWPRSALLSTLCNSKPRIIVMLNSVFIIKFVTLL